MTSNYQMQLKCPKCGAEMEDCRAWDEWGWFEDMPYRCSGHLIKPLPYPQASPDCALNRTPSCGYFSERDVK